MITIVSAMDRELAAARRGLMSILSNPPAPQAATLHVLGIGKQRSLNTIHKLLREEPKPELVVSMGFATALHEKLKPGDLILAQRLHAENEASSLEPSDQYLTLAQEAAQESRIPYFICDSITMSHVLSNPAEKRVAHESTGAWMANMEDYWIATALAQSGVPLLSVRAILDTADQVLPPKVSVLGDKHSPRTQLFAATGLALTRPWMLISMLRLWRQTKLAGQTLSAFIQHFLPKTLAQQTYSYA